MNGRGTHITVRRPTVNRKCASCSTNRRGLLNPLALVPGFIVLFSFVLVIGVAAQLRTSSPDNHGTGGDSSKSSDGESKVIKIDADRPLTREFRRLIGNATPPAQTDIEFNGGENRPWSFVRFDKLPEHTSITVKDKVPGYLGSGQLKADTWYPFKTMLPIVFNIDAQATAPVQLGFWFGYPEKQDEENIANQSIEKVRELAQENVRQATNVQVVAFYWGPSVVAVEPVSLAFAPTDKSKTFTFTGDSRTWTLVRFPVLPAGMQATINTASADDLTSRLQAQFNAGEWIGFKDKATLELHLDRSQLNFEVNSTNLNVEIALDRSPGRTKDAVSADIKAGNITSVGSTQLSVSWGQVDSNFWLIVGVVAAGIIFLGALSFGLWKRSPKSTPRARAPRTDMKVWNPFGGKKSRGRTRFRIGDDVLEPTPKIDPAPAPPLTITYPTIQEEDLDRVKHELENQISQLKGDLETKLRNAVQNQATSDYVTKRLSDLETNILALFTASLDDGLQSVRGEVSRLEQDQKAIKPDLVNLHTRLQSISEENVNRISEVDTRIKGELDQVQQMLVEQAFPESYFARTMGMILSKNILELHEGNLERLIGEAVNSFFQADVPRAESLQELRQRAESIIATLKNVLEIVSSKKPEVEHEVRLRFERAEALLAKISGLQSQLQSRKLTLETTLRIPVSAYAGARQTFMEELGRGIRSELDKLADPQNFFEGDLERLVTADLIAIVDICDKKVSLPVGSDSEVESLLQQLFQQAGLRPILPSSGEPFGTAEQDLVQMVPGAPGTSMTVAEVVIRGFYYTHRANETLLRKAGVMVYR